MTAGFESRAGRVFRDLVRGVPTEARWFSAAGFKEVIAPRAAAMISDGVDADLVKTALIQVLVPGGRREAKRRAARSPLHDHPTELEEILLSRIWQAVQRWDGVRVEGLCSLLGAQTRFAPLDAAREASEFSRRTRLYGGRYQNLHDRLVQALGRQLTLAEKRDAAREVLPDSARPERVDDIVHQPYRQRLIRLGYGEVGVLMPSTRRRPSQPVWQTVNGDDDGATPEDEVVERATGEATVEAVHAWLDRVPPQASALYRKWLARGRADAQDPPPYTVRPLLPYVADLLSALGDEPFISS